MDGICLCIAAVGISVFRAVFVEGLIFIVLSLTNVREAIFNAIPMALKKGVSAGIGLFIAFIGLQGANLVVNDDSTLLTYVKFVGDFHTIGIGALLALIGLFIIVVLHHKNIKGSILIGILATWILGMICEAIGLYVPDGKEFYSLYPTFRMIDFGAFGTTFGQCFNVDFSGVDILNFIAVLFAFLFVDIFDTLGTLIGVSTKANMLDEEGKLPRIRPALLADAIATSVGAIFGTSTTTTYVESSAGVAAGGRTGLSAMVTGLLFLLAIVFAPIFTAIPSFATAPALIFVGFLMISSIISIDFEDITEAVPAYLAMLAMPLMYSISEGIALGVISYVVINLLLPRDRVCHPVHDILPAGGALPAEPRVRRLNQAFHISLILLSIKQSLSFLPWKGRLCAFYGGFYETDNRFPVPAGQPPGVAHLSGRPDAGRPAR